MSVEKLKGLPEFTVIMEHLKREAMDLTALAVDVPEATEADRGAARHARALVRVLENSSKLLNKPQ